jgi:hypothetical protein
VDFLDKATACSVESIDDMMFTSSASVDNFYRETSYGQISVTGDVLGPYTIDFYSTARCDFWDWGYAAQDEAAVDGVDIDAYDRFIYVLPSNSCPAGGYGTLGGSPSQSWVFYCQYEEIFAHELGHNLTLHHASTTTDEYGDYSDIMGGGYGGLLQLNGPHMVQTGWLPSSRVETVNSSGDYDLALLEVEPTDGSIQVLKIAKPDTAEEYYLSYRVPVGFDSQLGPTCADKLNIHRWDGTDQTFFVTALSPGETFQDPINGVVITPEDHDGDTMTVSISMADCVVEPPRIAYNSTLISGQDGWIRQYGFTLTNMDSGAACSSATFSVSAVADPDWTVDLSETSQTLRAGELVSMVLTVTSPVGALEGDYPIQLEVSDGIEPLHTASVEFTYRVDITPPAAPTNLKASGSRTQIDLTWDPAVDMSDIHYYWITRENPDGSIKNFLSFTTSLIDTNVTRGATYTYEVVARDTVTLSSVPSDSVTVKAKGRRRR